QLSQNRVGSDGSRGSGSLYAMGLNYSLTGVFYNKKLAAQIGMNAPPKTLTEFQDFLAKAKAAGLLPIMEWGSAKSGMGLAFPLQALMASLGPVGPINAWIFEKPGAMSAPLTFGIAAKAKHADCAAFFFNWVATNRTGRQIDVSVGGSNPGGPAGAPLSSVPAGSVTSETLAAGNVIGKAGTAMDFIANATSSIFAQGWPPELQKMVGGKQDAAGLFKAVQAEYQREIT